MASESLNVIALISGGKDSFFNLLHCIRHGHRIVALANLFPALSPDVKEGNACEEDLNSFMYQTVGHEVIPLYAAATGLPLYRQPIRGGALHHERDYDYSPGEQKADETESMLSLLKAIKARHPEANALCSGAILSTYQRTRVESVALRLGLTPLAYLWKYPNLPCAENEASDDAQLLRDMAVAGLDARIIKVASAGLDEGHLWERVSSAEGINRVKSALRKFGAPQGAALGEGGEFETLVLDGPSWLFKKRISVPEERRRAVNEGGGPDSSIRTPQLFDSSFQSIMDTILSTKLADFSEKEIPGALTLRNLSNKFSTTLEQDDDLLRFSVLATPSTDRAFIAVEMQSIVSQIEGLVSSSCFDAAQIINTTIYGKLFTKANPPSRVTISSGHLLPSGYNVMMFLTVPKPGVSAQRNGLHVQSRSYWAPANIGPYSQAISLAVTSKAEQIGLQAIYIAGQIPLIPFSMTLPPPSETSHAMQIVLSLQHLWRVGLEMKVQLWTSAVAYFAKSSSPDEMKRNAQSAGLAWRLAHGSPEDDEDDENELDPWDLKYNFQHMTLAGDEQKIRARLPDWSIFTLRQQNEPESCVPPFFAVEVEELPRQSTIEWHAHVGLSQIEESSIEIAYHPETTSSRWRIWHMFVRAASGIVVYTTLANVSSRDHDNTNWEALQGELSASYMGSVRALGLASAVPSPTPHLAYVEAASVASLWSDVGDAGPSVPFAMVPCHTIWADLHRRQSTDERINTILEVRRGHPLLTALQRAETMDPASLSLLQKGSSHNSSPNYGASGVISRETPQSYQAVPTSDDSDAIRPRKVSYSDTARKDGSHAKGQNSLRQRNGVSGSEDTRTPTKTKSSWTKETFRKFQSLQLENKGSVARDHLALERTFLAWLRTSLAFASIGVAVTQLFRLNTGNASASDFDHTKLQKMGRPLGATFLAISIVTLLLGCRRYFHAQEWILQGKFPASRGTIIIMSFVALALMILSLVVEPIDVPSFAATQLALLDQELQSEIQETSTLISNHSPTGLQRAGLAITNLSISSQRTGLGGKTVLELSPDGATSSTGELPEHGIRTGDIVLVAEQPAGSAKKREVKELERKGARGVVTKVQRAAVNVALDDGKDEVVFAGRVWMVKLADEVTYRRMNQTMEKLQRMGEPEYSSFIRVLFGLSSPSPVPQDLTASDEAGNIEWIDPTLNDSQKDAIRFALASREVALIHGPPGTGKTHTLIELILQMIKRDQRILVCGPSNISVDNIVERLSSHKIPILRLGHPARLLPSVLNHSLDVLTQTSEAGAIVKDVRAEMDAKQASIKKTKSGKERKAIYTDLKELRKEYRERERRCVSNLVGGSKVVLATLHGAGGYQLRNEEFDVVIIDEASQALEAQCWVPLLSAKKVVCAGDHLQLPPTIKSLNSKVKPKSKGDDDNAAPVIRGMTLETTLFDRLLALHGPSIKRMLTTQYRMHEKIMHFPSDELYESQLIAADAVKARLLKDLEYDVENNEDTTEPVIFIDTQGGDFPERNEEDDKENPKKGSLHGESKSNEMEAVLVRLHVKQLVEAGVRPEDIAVVTPYNAQLAALASLKETFPGIELGSVDGFQGREKEAVIVSLVRSNPDGEVGFLGEKRRLNVAMTRPKRSLTVIGDSETVKRCVLPGFTAFRDRESESDADFAFFSGGASF
ncbi:hypothetical protein V8C35DRAFT_321664 [Trichoderma chlorosporum]